MKRYIVTMHIEGEAKLVIFAPSEEEAVAVAREEFDEDGIDGCNSTTRVRAVTAQEAP